jgi:acetyl-CoA synthetase
MTTTLVTRSDEVAAYWGEARKRLSGLPDGGLNIAFEAVDRHVAARGATTALRFRRKDGSVEELSYARLAAESSRFAGALRFLGIHAGDVVATVLGRCPELFIAALGTLKNRSIYCPLFSAFGPEPIRDRLRLGGARAVVTSDVLHRKKIASIGGEVPSLRHVLHTGDEFGSLLAGASETFDIPHTDPEDPALLHFTSGTTGKPKGALHVHEAVVAHHATAALALDLRPGDRFWCTADPGWVTGTSYGIIAPLTHGATLIVDEGEFDPDRWYRTIEEERVTVWYTAPTAIRMLMKAGAAVAKKYDLSSLRFIASVGEALNPQAVVWGAETFGIPIHDNWWQTETGGIMIANVRELPIRPGSMGKPLPGVEAVLVRRRNGGAIEIIAHPNEEGEIALHRGWPSMFRAYLGEEERYRKCFAGAWYLTGDLARLDEDGYFWFVGRTDDVIKSSGHLIGPFEVESALLDHPAVAEAAVIGKPDPTAGEIVKAFVALKPGFLAGDALRDELLGFARRKLGAVVAPKEIAFLDALPKTGSEKILRRLLKARELGLPEGDVSTVKSNVRST